MFQLIKILAINLLFLSACVGRLNIEKSDNIQGYADSQVVGNWKVTAYSSNKLYDWNGDGIKETNIYNTWAPCQKENLYQFAPDKSGIFKTSCTATSGGTWQIINTLYLVILPSNQTPSTEKIISMTSVEFKTTEDVTVSNGQNFTLTKTWTRQ